MDVTARIHYDAFLARMYSWMLGSIDDQVQKNRAFFSGHAVIPQDNHTAVDLGAGNGCQAIALAQLGYSVTAVDFCNALLEELRMHAGDHRIGTLHGDIRDFSLWTGQNPALITCMGDTLTHLRSLDEADELIRRCYSDLDDGGRFVLSLRDYSPQEAGEVAVIPVRRDNDRIFLCRLEYHDESVSVHDILYSRSAGSWGRTASQYTKIRIAPGALAGMLTRAGFIPEYMASENNTIVALARKKA